jgi:hypothetical protein
LEIKAIKRGALAPLYFSTLLPFVKGDQKRYYDRKEVTDYGKPDKLL